VSAGGGRTLRDPDLPDPVNGPVVALVGTIVVSLFDALTEKFANVALNNTAVTLVKLAPVMTTLLPTTPLVGVKLVSRGGT